MEMEIPKIHITGDISPGITTTISGCGFGGHQMFKVTKEEIQEISWGETNQLKVNLIRGFTIEIEGTETNILSALLFFEEKGYCKIHLSPPKK